MKRPLLLLLGVWILGECAARWAGIPLVPATPLEVRMEGRESVRARVSGTVRQIRRTSSGYSYVLTDVSALLDGELLPARDVLVFTDHSNDLMIGNRVEATGTLSPFELPGNPGQFNLREYYRALGIDYHLEESGRELRLRRVFPVAQGLYRIRSALENALDALEPPENAGVLESMLLGDRSQLTMEVRSDYQGASLSHILSISGLHVSLFGMGIYRLLRRLGLREAVILPGSAGLAMAYVEMTGRTASARRALILFLLYLGARAAGRTYDSLSALGTAGLFLLWGHPLLLFQSGFQLSFLAVLGVSGMRPLLREWLEEKEGRESGLLLSLSVQWAIWPVLAGMNGVIPLCGLWGNLLVLPLTAPLLVLAGLGSILGAAGSPAAPWILWPAEWILRWIRFVAHVSAGLPGQNLVTGCPAGWQIVLYAALLFLVLVLLRLRCRTAAQERRRREEKKEGPRAVGTGIWLGRRISLVLISGLLLFSLCRLPVRGLQITCIDVGQGNSVLVRDAGFCCLVDGGSSQVKEVGETRILPYLHNQGIAALDAVVLTHADSDHINGVAALLTSPAMRVRALCLTRSAREDPAVQELELLAQKGGTAVRVLEAGASWTSGGTDFFCLYPQAEDCADFSEDANNTSIVLEVRGEGISALLMGDLGTEGEERLERRGAVPRADVLVVGHHGSRYSSGEALLAAAEPSVGLISCGKRNRYGHPHPEALERLEQAGCRSFSTAECGALTVLAKGGSLTVHRFRPE